MEQLGYYHPIVVHFPIALLSLYVFTEILSSFISNDKLRFLATVMIVSGVISGVGAVLTGNQAEQNIQKIISTNQMNQEHEAIEEHETNATILLWYFTGLMILRYFFIHKKSFYGYKKILVTILAIIGFYFIFATGDYGGKLVYKYGIGTELFNEKNK